MASAGGRRGGRKGARTLLSQRGRAARRWEKDVGPAVATRADKAGHILDYAEHLDADLATEVKFLADVLERDLLRGRYEDGAVDASLAEILDDREVLVRRPWRRVDDEVVKLVPPIDILKKLLDELILLGTPPDDGGRGRGQEEADRDARQVGRQVDGRPA